MAKRFPLVSSPVYMDFLKGERDFPAPRGEAPRTTSKAGKARATSSPTRTTIRSRI